MSRRRARQASLACQDEYLFTELDRPALENRHREAPPAAFGLTINDPLAQAPARQAANKR
jgi:hypothetical protein